MTTNTQHTDQTTNATAETDAVTRYTAHSTSTASNGASSTRTDDVVQFSDVDTRSFTKYVAVVRSITAPTGYFSASA